MIGNHAEPRSRDQMLSVSQSVSTSEPAAPVWGADSPNPTTSRAPSKRTGGAPRVRREIERRGFRGTPRMRSPTCRAQLVPSRLSQVCRPLCDSITAVLTSRSGGA